MTLKSFIAKQFMRLCGIFPIQKKAVFISYYGKFNNCNPWAIYEEMRKQMPNYRYIWLLQDRTKVIDGAETVKSNSLKAIYHLATAALWVDNARKPSWTVKRKGQYYVQTWHGYLALKKIEKDAEEKLSSAYIEKATNDSKCADLFLSGCKWCSKNYREAFWWDKKILEYGLPRSDVFYQDGTKNRKRVYEFYHIPEFTNLAIYAPTFRNNKKIDAYLTVDDYAELISTLENRFGGTWKLIVRLHPNISDKQDFVQYNDMVLNGSKYSEINDLIIACNMLISDYSSCMFDAMQAGKNVLLYATDIDEYLQERGLYFSFDELPFPLAKNEKELFTIVKTFDFDKYKSDVKKFIDRIGNFNNADSSKKVSEYIIDQIKL